MNFQNIQKEVESIKLKKKIAKLEKGQNFFFNFEDNHTKKVLYGHDKEDKKKEQNVYSLKNRLERQLDMVPKFKIIDKLRKNQKRLKKLSRNS